MPTPTPTQAGKVAATGGRPPPPEPGRVRRRFWLLELYRSALGKKYVMALTGIFILGWLVGHLVGNFKIYLGAAAFDEYSHWLREGLGYPLLPHTWTLWIVRLLLLGAFVLHIHAAYSLTIMNRRARPSAYESERDWVAADFAARTMRWTGVILALYTLYHLADLTWGWVNPGGREASAYENTVQSLSRWPVAIFYIAASLALGYHLYHGAWSLFQSLGLNKPRFNRWRRWFAIGVAVVMAGGFASFPFAIWTGLVY